MLRCVLRDRLLAAPKPMGVKNDGNMFFVSSKNKQDAELIGSLVDTRNARVPLCQSKRALGDISNGINSCN